MPIVVITAFGNLETAVRALEGGAFDYLVKPFDLDQATSVVKRALEKREARERAPALAAHASPNRSIGSSPAMQDLFKSIALVAPAACRCLITGESGTGKELVARAIHRHSSRRDGPFLPICLAALSPSLVERELFGHVKGSFTGAVQDRKGLLELANGGTVLLDEIGDVPPSLQVKLLRAIEHGEVTPVGDARPRPTDIRVVAATNRPAGLVDDRGRVPRRPVLPAERFPDPHSPAARAPRRHSGAGRAFPATGSAGDGDGDANSRTTCWRSCGRGPGRATCESCATRSSTRRSSLADSRSGPSTSRRSRATRSRRPRPKQDRNRGRSERRGRGARFESDPTRIGRFTNSSSSSPSRRS